MKLSKTNQITTSSCDILLYLLKILLERINRKIESPMNPNPISIVGTVGLLRLGHDGKRKRKRLRNMNPLNMTSNLSFQYSSIAQPPKIQIKPVNAA